MGFIDESMLDPIVPSATGGQFIDPSMLDPVSQPSLLGEFGSGLWEGIKGTPRAAIDLGKGAYQLVRHPIDSLSDVAKDLDVTGRLAAGTSGAILGGEAGALTSPLTGPVGPLLGAAIGGGAGLLGYSKLNQVAGNEVPTTALQDARAFGQNTGTGIGFGVGGKVIGGGIKLARNAAEDLSTSYAQDAFGAKPSQIAKSIERGVQFLDENGNPVTPGNAADFTSKIERQLGNLRGSDLWKDISNDPKKAFIQTSARGEDLNFKKNLMIGSVDQALTEIQAQTGITAKLKPDWSIAEKFIENGRGVSGNKARLVRELDRIKADWATKNGTFEELIDFKSQVRVPKSFGLGPTESASVALREAIETGIKKSAENTFDALMGKATPKQLNNFAKVNSDISDVILAKELLGKKSTASSGVGSRLLNNVKSFKNLALGTTALLAPGAREATLGLIGADSLAKTFPVTASNLANKAAKIIDPFGAASGGAELLGGVGQKIGSVPSSVATAENLKSTNRGQIGITPPALPIQNSGRLIESQPSLYLTPPPTDTPQPKIGPSSPQESQFPNWVVDPTDQNQAMNLKIPKEIEKALSSVTPENRIYLAGLAQIESSFNPKAIGAKTSKGRAKGLFQFLDSTAKDYGLENPLDASESARAADEMFSDSLALFGDPLLAMVAHQRGAAGLLRDIKAAKSTDLDVLAEYNKAKNTTRALETANYIKKIKTIMEA